MVVLEVSFPMTPQPVHRLVGLSWWFPKWATSYCSILLLEPFFSFVFRFLQVFWKMKYYLKIVLSTWCKQSSLRCGDLSNTNLFPAYLTYILTYSHHPCPVMPAARSWIDSRSFGLIMSLFFEISVIKQVSLFHNLFF